MRLSGLWAAAGMGLLAAINGWSGVCTNGLPGPRHDFQLFAGYSPDSSHVFGSAEDRQFAVAGLTYGYRCWEPGPVSVYYTATLMPAALLGQPAQTVVSVNPPFQRPVGAHWVYGFAAAPIGFRFDFTRRRIHPFLETIGGVIASVEPIPEQRPNATGLNFLVGFGGGIRWNIGPRRALSFGYKFLHISNAGTTNFNPGVDNNVIYAGYSFER